MSNKPFMYKINYRKVADYIRIDEIIPGDNIIYGSFPINGENNKSLILRENAIIKNIGIKIHNYLKKIELNLR